jgi:hypothetical protein
VGDQKAWVDLAEAVRAVRAELRRAIDEGADEQPRLRVEQLEMEFAVELEREISGETKVNVWVVNAGGTLRRRRLGTHVLRVTLKPETESGDEVVIHSRAEGMTPRRRGG